MQDVLNQPHLARPGRHASPIMALEFTPLGIPLLLAAVINLALARYAWTRRSLPGALPFAALMASLAQWSVAYALVIAGTDLATKMFWYRVECFGVVAVCFTWILFIVHYAGWSEVLRPRIIVLLCCEPIVTLI